jgi:hypothetical protein
MAISLLFNTVDAKKYFVSPKGNDHNSGTRENPFQTWQRLSTVLEPGDTGFIRGGRYTGFNGALSVFCHWSKLNGTAEKPVVISAYPGEKPIMDCSGVRLQYPNPTALLIENCDFIHIIGLRITGLGQIADGSGLSRGMELRNASHNKIERCEIDNIGGYGFIVGENSNFNYFLNCDAHHISDPFTQGGAWGNANGFQCTGNTRARGTVFEGCRAWWISDDGFDLYGVEGDFSFKNCWAFWNGFQPGTFNPAGDGDGFKLGPSPEGYRPDSISRKLVNCVAAGNLGSGFDQNKGNFRFEFISNISQGNSSYGFMFDYITPSPPQVFVNNSSVHDRHSRRGKETNGRGNSWETGRTCKKLDIHSLSRPRSANGQLPEISFFR